MFAAMEISLLPPSASAFATEYDVLFWYITAVCMVGGLAVYAMVTYFCFAYAAKTPGEKTPRILGSVKMEIAWTLIPLFFFLTFFVWGVKMYNSRVVTPTDAPEFFIVGKQWMWKVQGPDGQREINELHVPVDLPFKLTGTSEDVIHDVGIPAFRSKFDVVPGRESHMWYTPTKVGTYHLLCDQYCGMGHSQMVGQVHVMTQAEYAEWKDGILHPDGNPVDGSAAWEGRKLFLKLQCNACHNPMSNAKAPMLEEMAGKYRPIGDGESVLFDTDYIKQSIRNPQAKVANGWKPIMPAFPVGQVDEFELRNLVAYIKSLKHGDLPKRFDNFPAPEGAPVKAQEEMGTEKKKPDEKGTEENRKTTAEGGSK